MVLVGILSKKPIYGIYGELYMLACLPAWCVMQVCCDCKTEFLRFIVGLLVRLNLVS